MCLVSVVPELKQVLIRIDVLDTLVEVPPAPPHTAHARRRMAHPHSEIVGSILPTGIVD